MMKFSFKNVIFTRMKNDNCFMDTSSKFIDRPRRIKIHAYNQPLPLYFKFLLAVVSVGIQHIRSNMISMLIRYLGCHNIVLLIQNMLNVLNIARLSCNVNITINYYPRTLRATFRLVVYVDVNLKVSGNLLIPMLSKNFWEIFAPFFSTEIQQRFLVICSKIFYSMLVILRSWRKSRLDKHRFIILVTLKSSISNIILNFTILFAMINY